jgi:hypothetical protein
LAIPTGSIAVTTLTTVIAAVRVADHGARPRKARLTVFVSSMYTGITHRPWRLTLGRLVALTYVEVIGKGTEQFQKDFWPSPSHHSLRAGLEDELRVGR